MRAARMIGRGVSDFFNSNAGSQILGAAASGFVGYVAGKAAQDDEASTLKNKLTDSDRVIIELQSKLEDKNTEIAKHIAQGGRDSAKIAKLRAALAGCHQERDLARFAVANSSSSWFGATKYKLPPNTSGGSESTFDGDKKSTLS